MDLEAEAYKTFLELKDEHRGKWMWIAYSFFIGALLMATYGEITGSLGNAPLGFFFNYLPDGLVLSAIGLLMFFFLSDLAYSEEKHPKEQIAHNIKAWAWVMVLIFVWNFLSVA